jgi:hypothetical protein
VGWTLQAEIDLLCEFWSRLANGKPAYRFPFNGFNAKSVYAKLVHMELLLDDPRLFRMPCSTPEHQQSIIISDCRLLANSEGKVTLGKGMEGAEGVMWERGNDVASTPAPSSPEKQSPPTRQQCLAILHKYAGTERTQELMNVLRNVHLASKVQSKMGQMNE